MNEKILNRVANLLNKAEDAATTPEESATYRAKAQELMQQYRIEEEQLIAVDQTSIEPIHHMMIVCAGASQFRRQYVDLAYYCIEHAGVEAKFVTTRLEGQTSSTVVAHLVGYEGDVRLAEMVYQSARLVFGERLEPKVEPALSDAENIYRLRSAGMSRRDVAWELWKLDTHAAHARVGETYKAVARARGEEPALDGRGISAGQYRAEYAAQFPITLYWRLVAARDAADSVGGGLVLHGRKERVQEAFWTRYPEYRPAAPSTEVVEVKPAKALTPRQQEAAIAKASRDAARRADRLKRERIRRGSAAATAGRDAGDRAAKAVSLSRASNAQRLPEGGPAPRAVAIES